MLNVGFVLGAFLCITSAPCPKLNVIFSLQHCVHHLSPHVPGVRAPGGQGWQEHHLGAVCCAQHPGGTHPAGLHLLEPLDSHGNLTWGWNRDSGDKISILVPQDSHGNPCWGLNLNMNLISNICFINRK